MPRRIPLSGGCRAIAEPLEGRVLLATFTVTNANDSGAGSLRQAILSANKTAAADVINFAIGSGARTITPASALPSITAPVTLDATTQPGYAGKPLIELSGSRAGSGAYGLKIYAGDSTVKGLVINRFGQSGMLIIYRGGNRIVGSYLGTDRTGSAAAGNLGHGILVQSSHNTIGGMTLAERNVISGNALGGVFVYTSAASGNKIIGNYIGTDATGTKAIANKNGVQVDGAPSNIIGGTTAAARNVISGNGRDGVLVINSGANHNVIQGNYIGASASGAARLGNAWYGVEISRQDNLVGGTMPGAGNVLSANGVSGVVLYLTTATGNHVEGNLIGTDATGTRDLGNVGCGAEITNNATDNTIGGSTAAAGNIIAGNDGSGIGVYGGGGNTIENNCLGLTASRVALPNLKNGVFLLNTSSNTIRTNCIAYNQNQGVQINSGMGNQITANSIYSNGRFGINLNADWITWNDAHDSDGGANGAQNFPVLSSAKSTSSAASVSGTFSGAASKTIQIELFSISALDSYGMGEGRAFLGAVTVTTDSSGAASFTASVKPVPAGQYITATATAPDGSTSEFCKGVKVSASTLTTYANTLPPPATPFTTASIISSEKDLESLLI